MRFILTRELGRLAKWLRIMGFDAEYYNGSCLSSLQVLALRDERIILTRNQRLAKTSGLRVVILKPETLKEQIAEVLKKLPMRPSSEAMFTRCVLCNQELAAIEKEKVKDKVPEYVFQTQNRFLTCPVCKRIYWQGTHWGNITETLKEIM